MAQYINKATLVAEIERRVNAYQKNFDKADNKIARLSIDGRIAALKSLLPFIDTLEVKDPYEQCVQYDSIKAGIQAHAETYSFNIESNLFNQLTKEQQKLWRKEIEQACVNGGEVGAELARDTRYKENLEVKEVDLTEEINHWQGCEAFPEGINITPLPKAMDIVERTAKHFFELGLNYIKSNKNE